MKKIIKQTEKMLMIGETWLYILILGLIIIIVYHNLPGTFYQQDEWTAVGNAMVHGFSGLIPRYSLLQILVGQGRVIATPINYIFYYYFPLKVLPFAIFSITLHFFNSLLVFGLVYQLSKNRNLARVSALFFGTAYIGAQAVTWPAATTATLPAAFFSFLSLNIFTYFLYSKRIKYLYLSLISVIIAFLFKESCIFIFLLFPIIYLLFRRTKFSLSKMVKIHLPFILYLLFVFGIRILSLRFGTTSGVIYPSAVDNTLYKILTRLIFYPLESLSQIFINGSILYPMARIFVRDNYYRIWGNPGDAVVVETIAADMLSMFFSFLVIGVVLIIFTIKKSLRKITVFGIAFTLLSFTPYIFIDKPTAFIESRHFYMGVAGGGILLALFLKTIKSMMINKIHFSQRIASMFVMAILFLFLVVQINYVHRDINAQVALATERRKFLESLYKLYPTIPENPIFYITSDHDYYIPGNKIPFQHGFGYSLMVLYFDTGFIPEQLITSEYLWMMPDQGYTEVYGKGFGYFWNLDKLKQTVLEKKLDADSIVAARYDAGSMILTDITQGIRMDVVASVSAMNTQ